MNINDTFSGALLKAADLKGAQPTVTIADIKMEKLGDDTKPVLYFAGKEKGVALNKTNATNISAAYGPETDHWIGKRVILFSAWVDFQGKSVEAIRIRPAPAQQAAPVQQQTYQPPAPPPQQHVPQFDNGPAFPGDDIPF
jgi:hypothetical protein